MVRYEVWELGPPHFRMMMHSAGDETSPLQSVPGGAGDETSPLQNAVRDAASAHCAAAAAAGCAHIVLAAVTAAVAPHVATAVAAASAPPVTAAQAALCVATACLLMLFVLPLL